jgi:hypothetical protein
VISPFAGSSRQLLLAALDRRVLMLVSVPLILEYEAVLKRPEHLDVIGVNLGGNRYGPRCAGCGHRASLAAIPLEAEVEGSIG